MGNLAIVADRTSPMEYVELSVGPVIAGLLGLDSDTLALPLVEGGRNSLREVLELLEKRSPGALLEPRTRLLHRYIHVHVNRRPVSDMERQVTASDKMRVDMRLIEGG